jgi:hypothetical protein
VIVAGCAYSRAVGYASWVVPEKQEEGLGL